MSTDPQAIIAPQPTSTTIGAKLVNMFVCPGLVFDEVIVAAPNAGNWLVPVVLVCLSSVLALKASTDPQQIAATIAPMLQAGDLPPQMTAWWQGVSIIALCVAVCAGTFWSALVLWLLGKVFLKSQFAFHKALEVAGLSGTILVLGAVVTSLLIAATGNVSARPALSLLCHDPSTPGNLLRNASLLLDFFHVWVTAVLAVGLSKLAGVSVKESAFWVLGYWLVLRIALALLA